MFGEWKKIIGRVREKLVHKKRQKPEKLKLEEYNIYNWSWYASDSINFWSLLLLCSVSVVTICHILFYWHYNLWVLFWLDTAVCIIAEILVVCWAIYWWRYLFPSFIITKGQPRISKFNIGLTILITPFYAINIVQNMRISPVAIGMITFLLLWFGAFIAARFVIVWSRYRKSDYYEKVSFIDYCNTPR